MEVSTANCAAKTRQVHHDTAFKRKVTLCTKRDRYQSESIEFLVPETCLRYWRKQKEGFGKQGNMERIQRTKEGSICQDRRPAYGIRAAASGTEACDDSC